MKPEQSIATNVRVSISRASSNIGPDTYVIRLDDVRSNLRVAEVTLTPEQFALAITGAPQEAPATIFTSKNFGRTLETRTFPLPMSRPDWDEGNGIPIEDLARRLLSRHFPALRVDEWELDVAELRKFNPHRFVASPDGGRYTVFARRYVKTGD